MLNDNIQLRNQIFDLILTEALKEDSDRQLAVLDEKMRTTEEHKFSDKTKKYIFSISNRLKRLDNSRKIKRAMPKVGVTVVVLIFGLAVFTNPNVNAFFSNIISKIFPDHNQYEFNDDKKITIENFDYDIKPSYVSEGYRISQCFYGFGTGELIYESDDGIINIQYGIAEGTEYSVDNEHSVQNVIEINGKQFVFHKSIDEMPSFLVWVDSGYAFMLSAQLSQEEFVKIAESINIS